MVVDPLTGATFRAALALVVPAGSVDVVFGTVALLYVLAVWSARRRFPMSCPPPSTALTQCPLHMTQYTRHDR